jgi:hypothetical protein
MKSEKEIKVMIHYYEKRLNAVNLSKEIDRTAIRTQIEERMKALKWVLGNGF